MKTVSAQEQRERQERLAAIARSQPYPLLFATLSGAHLYGFASPDSDYDVRGVHVLPARALLGLDEPEETLEVAEVQGGLELDLVTHDARKFMLLMLRPNGYVLEQLFSPLVILTTPEHEELKALGKACITRTHLRHYEGFAQSQWRLFAKEQPPRVKPLLYVFRVLLTGIHLLRTGEIEANLLALNEAFRLPFIAELIARKEAGPEHGTLDTNDTERYHAAFDDLLRQLRDAYEESRLPDAPAPEIRAALNALLLRLRQRDTSGK